MSEKTRLINWRIFLQIAAVEALVLVLFLGLSRQKPASKNPIVFVAPDTSRVSLMALSPDGRRFAQVLLTSQTPAVRFVNARSGVVEYNPPIPFGNKTSPDNLSVVSQTAQKTPLVQIAFSADGKKLAAIDEAGSWYQWNASSGAQEKQNASKLPVSAGRIFAA